MQASIDGWRKRHPLAVVAHEAVQQAVKAGTLKRGPCCLCGSTRAVHGHHADYTKPLVVTWYCHLCHMEHHRLARLNDPNQFTLDFGEVSK